MSLPDGAEYWQDVKNRTPYTGRTFRHHPTHTCSHFNKRSGNALRTPYKNDVNCFECAQAIENGNLEGIIGDIAPEYFYLGKKEKKRYNAQKLFEETHGKCSCGSDWKIRTNKTNNTQFLGCSNYPKCKNTKSIELTVNTMS